MSKSNPDHLETDPDKKPEKKLVRRIKFVWWLVGAYVIWVVVGGVTAIGRAQDTLRWGHYFPIERLIGELMMNFLTSLIRAVVYGVPTYAIHLIYVSWKRAKESRQSDDILNTEDEQEPEDL